MPWPPPAASPPPPPPSHPQLKAGERGPQPLVRLGPPRAHRHRPPSHSQLKAEERGPQPLVCLGPPRSHRHCAPRVLQGCVPLLKGCVRRGAVAEEHLIAASRVGEREGGEAGGTVPRAVWNAGRSIMSQKLIHHHTGPPHPHPPTHLGSSSMHLVKLLTASANFLSLNRRLPRSFSSPASA